MNSQVSPLSESQALKEKVFKNLLYISIFSIVMLFGGLTSAYIVSHADSTGDYFTLPRMFWYSSAAILISSLTMNMAVNAARDDQQEKIVRFLTITLVLGLLFGVFQILGWKDLYESGIVFAGKQSYASGSFVYVMSGVHLAHMLSGIIYLLLVLAKSTTGKYHSGNYFQLKHCGIYWHFLDILWIYLFVFLLVIR